jgi:hypothetical protein
MLDGSLRTGVHLCCKVEPMLQRAISWQAVAVSKLALLLSLVPPLRLSRP